MAAKRIILEMGSGNDLHGGDYTKAAIRAVQDALHHSSLSFIRSLGVDSKQMQVEVTIGAQTPERIAAEINDFEPTVAFDPLGDGFVAVLVEAVALRGRIISFGVSAGADVSFNMQSLYRKMVSLLGYGGMTVARDERRAGLQEALEAVRAGDLKVRIDEVLPLEQVNEAFQRLVDRQVRGNLLLDLS